ncbi:MAG: polyprenyl synthetase family protein [Chloroflexi bacterium]|nr:polyprenyl synthetase family protein [Chloroflexota bacterium]
MSIGSIFKPVQPEMTQVEDRLDEVARTAPLEMIDQLKHALKDGGKRIRPALTLLTGKLYKYNLDLLLPMATGVELLHTATLVHDDTIDDSQLRRGKASIKHRWGNSNAVLLGDYLFATSAGMVAETRNIRVIKLFAQTLMTICTGEIEESVSIFNKSRERYFQTIGDKTASLFAAATESGAVLSKAPEDVVQSLKSYGYNLGMSFQIVDDILDFVGQKETLGKPVASDLSKGIFTLPVILLFERPESDEVREAFEKDSRRGTKQLMEMVHNSSVLDEGYRIAQDFASRACSALERLPRNTVYDSLTDLAGYVTERKS